MERKQEGRREVAREKGTRGRYTETGKTKPATTLSVAKEANTSAGDNGACSNGGNREDKRGGSERVGIRCWGSSKMGPLCYGHRSRKELLCLQEIWAHGPSLQELGTERKNSG